ncbi:MFS transporter [Streptomyces sp. NPDC093089]|uniref:MFS transporter n=1 Tax=Streptomyces sp. NPDC093089 TaxID=3366024 RepID=UPI00382D6C9B
MTEARAGLLVTVYALAAALTAIPATAWTLIVPRRTLLVALLVGFAYIAPFVERADLGIGTGTVLFVFGLGSMAGVWLAGATADRHLRTAALALLNLATLCLASLGLLAHSAPALLLGTLLWGSTHGGLPTLMQTAGVRAAPDDPDTANSLWVTGWNIGMATGSLLGSAILISAGTSALPWTAGALLAASALTSAFARRSAFPPAA